MSMSFGIIGGGSHLSLSRVLVALRNITNLIDEMIKETALVQQPEINIVYHLPGDLVPNEHVGLRTGKFSKNERALMIQVAVSEAEMNLPDHSDYIFKSIRDCIDMAAPRFAKHGWNFSWEDHLRFIDDVERIWNDQEGELMDE